MAMFLMIGEFRHFLPPLLIENQEMNPFGGTLSRAPLAFFSTNEGTTNEPSTMHKSRASPEAA